MRIRQSDLASFARCAQEKRLKDLQRDGLLPKAPEQLSNTAYGSVMHHAVRIMEEYHHRQLDDPLGHAQATFEYFWHAENIDAICPPVTIWTPRQTWSGLLRKGLRTLEIYWEHLRRDNGRLLGLEVSFTLPYPLDGVMHELHGTIDRLSVRRASRAYLNVEDFKTGKDYLGLRWNTQFTVYSWATLQPGFWDAWGAEGPALYERFRLAPRRGTWISLRDGAKRSDAGYRGDLDYARMDVALREYVRAVEAGIYPLTLMGSVCRFCPFREGICGGVPVPEESYGS